jgi:hypothetical protein
VKPVARWSADELAKRALLEQGIAVAVYCAATAA